ncbi:MAG: sodium/solute symporter [Pirellulales bacterium]|nr:sodium/solute symporter [Pirellulales bacterium]
MHLTLLDLIVVIGYLAGLSLMGVYFSRRQTSEESYFLGNRRMPALLVGVSVMATLISTLSYLSSPGEMIRNGTGYFTSMLSFIVVVPVVNFIIIPALMKLPVTTVYEYFEKRFNYGVRGIGAVVFIVMRLTWVGLIIYTASLAVAKMTGWDIQVVILVVGLITTFYTTAGGMPAVIWSDFIQGMLLIGGALFIPVYIALQTGTGPGIWWETFSQAGRTSVPVFSLDPTVRITIVGIIIESIFWHICTHSADQVAAQRYLSTSSVKEARKSVWVSAIFTVTLLLLLMVVGLAIFNFYFQQSDLPIRQFQEHIAADADNKLPEFIARELPTGLSGLLLAALLAAAMSSLSSGINSISSVVVTDFVERLGSGGAKTKTLTLAMMIAAAAGLSGVAMALGVNQIMEAKSEWNLVDMVERINHLFVAPLGVLFLAGVLLRRVGTTAVILGFMAGVCTSVCVSFSKEIFHLETGLSFMWIMPLSFVVGMAVSFVTGFFLPRPSKEQLESLSTK